MRAVLSPCGQWRYTLERDLSDTGPLYLFCGVNPSTADHELEDQTAMKWRGFVTRWGGRGYIAINPWAYRSTDVRALAAAADPIGPDNDEHILNAMNRADIFIPCWGSRGKLPPSMHYRLGLVEAAMRSFGKPLLTLGFTASGDPKHPLMLGYDTELVPWT